MSDYNDILKNVKNAPSSSNNPTTNLSQSSHESGYTGFYKDTSPISKNTQVISSVSTESRKSNKLPWILAIALGIALLISSAYFMTQVNQLTQDNNFLIEELAKVNKKNGELIDNSRAYNKIIKTLRNNAPTNNYFAKEYLVVIGVGETKTIPVTMYYTNTQAVYNGTSTASSADWNYYWNGYTTSWIVTGNKPGTDCYNFWIEGRDDKFSICVVVTE